MMKKRVANILVLGVLFIVLLLVPVTSFAASVTITDLTSLATTTLTPGSGLDAIGTVPAGYTSGFTFAAGTYAGFTIVASGGLTALPALLLNDTANIDAMTLTGLQITPLTAGDQLQIVYDHTFVGGANGFKAYTERAVGTIIAGTGVGQTVSLGTAGCFTTASGCTPTTPNVTFNTLNVVVSGSNSFAGSLALPSQNCNFTGPSGCRETLRQTLTYTFLASETLKMPGSLSAISAYDADGTGQATINNYITTVLVPGESVPEPNSLLLLGTGLVFLGWVARKRLLALGGGGTH